MQEFIELLNTAERTSEQEFTELLKTAEQIGEQELTTFVKGSGSYIQFYHTTYVYLYSITSSTNFICLFVDISYSALIHI